MLAEIGRKIIPRNMRTFLRAPDKAFLYMAHCISFSVSRKGRHYQARPEWGFLNHPVSYQAFMTSNGAPEFQAELDEFIRYAQPGMVLYDIGSHYGFYTFAALHYGGPEARVVALDPSPAAGRIFNANLRLNHAESRVIFIPAAVGTSQKLPMLTLGAYGEYMLMAASDSRPDSTFVDCITLESLAGTTGLLPTHVKIDVEGYEDQVIESGERFLEKHRPIILLELHSEIMKQSGKDPVRLLDRLQKMGYRFARQNRALDPKVILTEGLSRFVCVPI